MTDDRGGGPEWPIDRRRDRIDTSAPSPRESRTSDTEVVDTRTRGINPVYVALGGVLLLLVILWVVVGRGNSDQDKLTGAESNAAAAADPEKMCSSKQTYDLIKQELFRRAAQVRGSDQAAFDKLSAYAALRMQNPVMESDDEQSRKVNCSGSLALDLPPGVQVAGGRRTLESDVDYTVQPAADGTGNVVLLRNADAIITPLATLARIAQAPAPSSSDDAATDDSGMVAEPEPVTAPPSAAAPSQPAPPTETAGARPSFNCANARTGSEKAVCADSGLASLDRQMASQYGAALSAADPGERALLESTRSRFLAYRERCGSNACIADSYRGRIREIRDIMEGRWHPR